jgi:hypothetical protein
MSVEFQFRNKKKLWSRSGTPTYSMIRNLFESGRIRGSEVIRLPKEDRLYPTNAFSIHGRGDCWIQIYDTKKYPTIKMSHLDHMACALAVLEQIAAVYDCVLLNDLDHGDSEIWKGKPPARIANKKSTFGIKIKPINISFGLKGLK